MRQTFFRKIIVYYLSVFLIIFFFILFIDYLGFSGGLDTGLYDLFFRLRGQRGTDERIIIVSIDEKTLNKFGRWPLNRKYYALLLKKVYRAKAVGFDIIFAEPAEEDKEFAAIIKKYDKVILPVYLDMHMNLVYPGQIFSPCKTGHIHVEPDIDGVVRKVYHTLYYGNLSIPSFSSTIYEVINENGFDRKPLSSMNLNLRSPDKIIQLDRMLINYYGPPATFPFISMCDVVEGRLPDDFFLNKIVLVGLTVPGIVDTALIPFSYHRNRMPGIEVHANILNNLIDGSSIKEVSNKNRYLLSFLISFFLLFFFFKTNEKISVFFWLTGLIVIFISTYLCFTHLHCWGRPFIFYCGISLAFLTAYIYRLDEAARRLDARCLSIISLPGMENQTSESYIHGKGLMSFLSAAGINARVQKLISVEDEYEEKLQKIIDEKTMKLSEALTMVKSMTNEIIFRLTSAAEFKDEPTGRHISRVGLYAKRLSEALGMPEDFVEQIALASAMHDIGKIGIPDAILTKKGPLTAEEFDIIKRHTYIGERILSGSKHPMIQMAARIALYHHERWNGTGYPEGLSGKDIPVEARIVMLCDIYEALRSPRPYKKQFTHQEAFFIITRGDFKTSPEDFDPDVLQVFIKIHPLFEEIFDEFSDS